MALPPISLEQENGDGVQVDFPFAFLIAPTVGELDVYVTPAGQTPNELNDIVLSTTYTIVTNTPISPSTLADGKVTFGVAPADGTIVTITPKQEAKREIDFVATTELLPENLNRAFDRDNVAVNQNIGLFNNRAIRYDINIDENDIQYSTLLPALPQKGFWRRNNIANGEPDAGMLAQDFDEFVDEVSIEVTQSSGFLEEIDTTATPSQVTFNLVSGGTPWEGVLADTLEVYVNGARQGQDGAYSVNPVTNPTVSVPSTISFITPLTGGEKVIISRPKPTQSTTLMNIDSSNATFNANSRVATRALDNLDSVSKTGVGATLGSSTNTPDELVLRDSSGDFSAGVADLTTAKITNGSPTTPDTVMVADGTNALYRQNVGDFFQNTMEPAASGGILSYKLPTGSPGVFVRREMRVTGALINGYHTVVFSIPFDSFVYSIQLQMIDPGGTFSNKTVTVTSYSLTQVTFVVNGAAGSGAQVFITAEGT